MDDGESVSSDLHVFEFRTVLASFIKIGIHDYRNLVSQGYLIHNWKMSEMSAYKYISKAWRNPSKSYVQNMMRQLAERWRKEPAILRLENPTRLDRARRFGYKAKQGYTVVRVRIRKGGARKIRPASGRRQKALGVTKFTRGKSLKKIAEARAAKRFPNMLPLNSYWTWEDGKHKWFEVVMVDPNHPGLRNYKGLALPEKI